MSVKIIVECNGVSQISNLSSAEQSRLTDLLFKDIINSDNENFIKDTKILIDKFNPTL